MLARLALPDGGWAGAPGPRRRARARVPVHAVRRCLRGAARRARRAGVQGRVRRAHQPAVPRPPRRSVAGRCSSRPGWPTCSRSPTRSTRSRAGDPPARTAPLRVELPGRARGREPAGHETMRRAFGVPVGWSDHTLGTEPPSPPPRSGARHREAPDPGPPRPGPITGIAGARRIRRDGRRHPVGGGRARDGDKGPTAAEEIAAVARRSLHWARDLDGRRPHRRGRPGRPSPGDRHRARPARPTSSGGTARLAAAGRRRRPDDEAVRSAVADDRRPDHRAPGLGDPPLGVRRAPRRTRPPSSPARRRDAPLATPRPDHRRCPRRRLRARRVRRGSAIDDATDSTGRRPGGARAGRRSAPHFGRAPRTRCSWSATASRRRPPRSPRPSTASRSSISTAASRRWARSTTLSATPSPSSATSTSSAARSRRAGPGAGRGPTTGPRRRRARARRRVPGRPAGPRGARR